MHDSMRISSIKFTVHIWQERLLLVGIEQCISTINSNTLAISAQQGRYMPVRVKFRFGQEHFETYGGQEPARMVRQISGIAEQRESKATHELHCIFCRMRSSRHRRTYPNTTCQIFPWKGYYERRTSRSVHIRFSCSTGTLGAYAVLQKFAVDSSGGTFDEIRDQSDWNSYILCRPFEVQWTFLLYVTQTKPCYLTLRLWSVVEVTTTLKACSFLSLFWQEKV